VPTPAPAWKLWTALWTLYLVWGSTYLAIKVNVESLPPLLSAGLRFALAGALVGAILLLRGRSLRVAPRELAAAALMGASLLACGVGVVTLAETHIASSTAAIIASSVPLQVIVLRSLSGAPAAWSTRLSVAIGLAGVALIVLPGGRGENETIGLLLMVAAAVSWALGSFFSRRLPLPRDPFVATTYEMLAGAALLLAAGGIRGEGIDLGAASARSVAAFAYLVVIGSVVGFTAYVWLLDNAPISKVVTHQYVNPLVAILLGALVLSEELRWTTLVGAGAIVSSVFWVVRRETGEETPTPAAGAAPGTPADQSA
jgi:drug/metabolite transporter (DMT)-like permease